MNNHEISSAVRPTYTDQTRPAYNDNNTSRRWTATMSARALEQELSNLAELRRHGLETAGDRVRVADIDRELARRAAAEATS